MGGRVSGRTAERVVDQTDPPRHVNELFHFAVGTRCWAVKTCPDFYPSFEIQAHTFHPYIIVIRLIGCRKLSCTLFTICFLSPTSLIVLDGLFSSEDAAAEERMEETFSLIW